MHYRIVSIENPAEVHVRDAQLIVIQDKGTASIPVKDISVLVVCGPYIRMSTLAQTILAQNKVAMLYLGRNHHPAALLLPYVGYARQARVTQMQSCISPTLQSELWQRIIVRKIANQGRALAILGLKGAEQLMECAGSVLPNDADNREGHAAKLYFQYLQPGLNRRVDDPLNSALNYGYAIARAMMARELVCAGFIPALGLHHHSQLNSFNLVDDLMEPLRPSIDLMATSIAGKALRLSRRQRSALRDVGRLAVLMDTQRVPVITAMRRQVVSLRKAIAHEDSEMLDLPMTLEVELLEMVEE